MALDGFSYTIKYVKGVRVILENGYRKLTKEEMIEFDSRNEERNSTLKTVCINCGKHSETTQTKTGKIRKKKCPSCNELMELDTNVYHCKKDESQVKRMVKKFQAEGYNKEQAHQFYDSAIEGTKRRIEGVGGAQHYKAMVPDMDFMVKAGVAKPVDGEKKEKLQKARKEVVVKHGKKIKVDRSNNTQSIK